MKVDIERALILSRKALVHRGFGVNESADAVYSFCLFNIFEEKVDAPRELIKHLKLLGVDKDDTQHSSIEVRD